jgi:DNA-binding MarR family transcriptional regulator
VVAGDALAHSRMWVNTEVPDDSEPAGPLATLSLDAVGGASPLIVAIDDAVDAQRELEQELRSEFGTNNTDFRALLLVFRLRRRGRPVRPGDLTRGLGISSGATSQIIGRLTAASLLERTPDPTDARAGALTLSADATDRLAAATASVRADLDAIVAALDPAEEARLIELLERVRDVFMLSRRGAH